MVQRFLARYLFLAGWTRIQCVHFLVPRSVDLDLEILVNVDYGRAISIKNFIAALRKRSGGGTEQFSDSEIAHVAVNPARGDDLWVVRTIQDNSYFLATRSFKASSTP